MRFELLVLGSSAALPTAERFCSAQLLRTASSNILIDCGEGTQIQLQRSGAGYGRVDLVLISHLHGDHYFGLPGLLTSMVLNDRKQPLTIISPPGLSARLLPILEWDKYSWPYEVKFIELPLNLLLPEQELQEPQLVFSLPDLEILAFPLRHRLPTAGYLIREKKRLPNLLKEQIKRYEIPFQQLNGIKRGSDFRRSDGSIIAHEALVTPALSPRSFAYCSDTRYHASLANLIKGVDLLYHEATFLHELLERAEATLHSTAKEAAMLARAAKVKQLLIGHFSSRYPSTQALLEEARAIFPATVAARDLELHSVPFTSRSESEEL